MLDVGISRRLAASVTPTSSASFTDSNLNSAVYTRCGISVTLLISVPFAHLYHFNSWCTSKRGRVTDRALRAVINKVPHASSLEHFALIRAELLDVATQMQAGGASLAEIAAALRA